MLLDDQIEYVSILLSSSDSNVLKDFCRAIEPPLKKGESFVEDMVKKNIAEEGNTDLATQRCLKIWIEENPERDFMCAVYNAFRIGMENNKLAGKLWQRFHIYEKVKSCYLRFYLYNKFIFRFSKIFENQPSC